MRPVFSRLRCFVEAPVAWFERERCVEPPHVVRFDASVAGRDLDIKLQVETFET